MKTASNRINTTKDQTSPDMKKIVLFFALMLPAMVGWAQTDAAAPAKSFMDDPFNHPMMPLYAVTVLVFITIVLVMLVAFYMLRILNTLVEQTEKERAEKSGKVYVPKPSWWAAFWQQINDFTPVSKEVDIDLGHDYDGIRELDNHLPPWWKWLFYATIIWGAVYLVVYHVTVNLPLSGAEYQNEVSIAAEQARIYRASQPATTVDPATLVYTADETILTKGKLVFTSNNCASCHRPDGGGNAIGPNLTDDYWIHGGGIKNIFATIRNGVVEKGMPAWGKVMNDGDVRDVAFYIMSLHGTNPANPKAPQGDLYKQEAPSDTTKQAMMK